MIPGAKVAKPETKNLSSYEHNERFFLEMMG
jgi:hypothetical protein